MEIKKSKSYIVSADEEKIVTDKEFDTNTGASRFIHKDYPELGERGYTGFRGKYLVKEQFDDFERVKLKNVVKESHYDKALEEV